MNVFGELFGGVLKHLDAEEVFKHVATQATASVAKGPLTSAFQRMKVEGRRTLAARLRAVAEHLDRGECAAAAEVSGEIIGGIRL